MEQYDEEKEKRRNKRMILFAALGIIIIFVAIGAYILDKYGTLTLSPGEHYTVNIPFFGPSNNPVIEGYAKYVNGSPVKNVNVTVKYKGNNTVLAWNTTNENGYYRIVLPEIKTNKQYDIYVGYDNSTLTLANHDYTLNLDTNKRIYNKSVDTIVFINGTIDNEDAEIKNGRMEVNLKYCNESSGNCSWEEIFDYKKYYINADPNENYVIPNDEVNITWEIPSDASIGKYKFYIKTSFNAKEKTKTIYFNITE